MQMEGVEAKELSALHGSLMAFDWIEQNTGQALMLANGTLSACYRITLNGLREYGRFHGLRSKRKPLRRLRRRCRSFRGRRNKRAICRKHLSLLLRGNRSSLLRDLHDQAKRIEIAFENGWGPRRKPDR